MVPFCCNCGEKVDITWNLCPKCGQYLNFGELQRGQNPSDQTTHQAKENHNPIDIPVAQPIRRLFAGLIDIGLAVGLTAFAYSFLLKRIALTGTKLQWAALRAMLTFLPAVYFLVRDSLGGKSFGKFFLGLTTISTKRGEPANLTDSFLRNSMLAIIAIPILGWIAFAVLAAIIAAQISMGRKTRIGDEFANTQVVEDRCLELSGKR